MDGAAKLSCCLQTQALGTGSATALAVFWEPLFQGSSPMRVPKAWGNPWLSITGSGWEVHPPSPCLSCHGISLCPGTLCLLCLGIPRAPFRAGSAPHPARL